MKINKYKFKKAFVFYCTNFKNPRFSNKILPKLAIFTTNLAYYKSQPSHMPREVGAGDPPKSSQKRTLV